MKTVQLGLALLACSLTSCDKAGKVLGDLVKESAQKSAETTSSTHGSSLVSEISQVDYESFRAQNDKVVVTVFFAEWCAPCRQLAPILEKIANEKNGAIVVGRINVDNNGQLAVREAVRGIPDVRIYVNGREVDRFAGLPSEDEVRRRLESAAKNLQSPAANTADKSSETQTPQPAQPAVQPMTSDWLPPGMKRR